MGCQSSASAVLRQTKKPGTSLQEGVWAPGLLWMGKEKLFPKGIRFPDHPDRSELLYQLRYPGPFHKGLVKSELSFLKLNIKNPKYQL
jgi:hypothetical protein